MPDITASDRQTGILVTGAGSGLGQAIACHLAAPNAAIWLHHHRSEQGVQQTADQAKKKGAEPTVVKCNLAEPTQRAAMMDSIEKAQTATPLKILIHNASWYCDTPLLEGSAAQFSQVLEANCVSLFEMVQQAAPWLSANTPSHVIVLGDSGADRIIARPHATPYHISKLGLHVLVRSLAVTLGKQGVQINMISPGFLEKSVGNPGNLPAAGRLGQYHDILGAVDYLLSPAAAYVNGANLVVSGGWNC